MKTDRQRHAVRQTKEIGRQTQTDRQSHGDRQTDRQTDRARQTDRLTERQRDRQTYREGRQTDRESEMQTDRQTDRLVKTEVVFCACLVVGCALMCSNVSFCSKHHHSHWNVGGPYSYVE